MNAHASARIAIRRESDLLRKSVEKALAGLPHGSAAALAGHLGVTRQTVSGWLSGDRPLASAHFGAVKVWLRSR